MGLTYLNGFTEKRKVKPLERLNRGVQLLKNGHADLAFLELREVDLKKLTGQQRILWLKESHHALQSAGRTQDALRFLEQVAPLLLDLAETSSSFRRTTSNR